MIAPVAPVDNRVSVKIKPVPIYRKQADFMASKAWLVAFFGGRGVGKTWIGSYRIQRLAKRGEPYMCVSPDAGVVHETTFPTFVEVAKQTKCYIRDVKSPYPVVWWKTNDGGTAEIVFRSGEVPKKLRGPSKAGLWIDEASVVTKEAFEVAIATLRHKGKMGNCILTGTPKGKAHWTFAELFEPCEPDVPGAVFMQGRSYLPKADTKLIHARTLDNPFLPEEFYRILRARYSSALAQQELEGDFVDIAGIMFRREWFMPVDVAPRDAMRVRYWDRASSPGSGKYSAGVLMAKDRKGIFYVENVKRGQWSYFDRNQIMEQTAEDDRRKYQGEVVTHTEQEGGSAGKEVSQQIITQLMGHPVYSDVVGGKKSRMVDGQELPGDAKVIRAMSFAAQAEAGNVRIVRGAWNSDYLDEITAFPEYTYSDQVDASSGAFNKLATKGGDMGVGAEKTKTQVDSSRFGALYALELARQRQSRR